jgi:hypothetical protein
VSQPIAGTLAEAYLRRRGITALHATNTLRFHPRCYYRPDENSPMETWPALIAAVTDLGGRITGVGYGSASPIDRQLGDLRLPVSEKTSLNEFLGALRGALDVAGALPGAQFLRHPRVFIEHDGVQSQDNFVDLAEQFVNQFGQLIDRSRIGRPYSMNIPQIPSP